MHEGAAKALLSHPIDGVASGKELELLPSGIDLRLLLRIYDIHERGKENNNKRKKILPIT